jgi:hypothetical protein
MSEWEQRIRTHTVWEEMKDLGPAIDAATALPDLEPKVLSGLERIRAVLAFCGKRLAAVDPLIATPAPLDGIASSLNGAKEELRKFIADADVEHVSLANARADAALASASQILGPSSSEELGGLIGAISEYRDLLERNLVAARASGSAVNAEAETLRTKLGELTVSLQGEQQKLSQIASDYQRQFSEAQEKRSQEYTDALRQAQADLAKVTSEHQGQFSTAQDARSREFTENQTTRQTKFNEVVADYTDRLSKQNAEFTTQRDGLIRDFQENLKLLNTDYSDKASAILKAIEEHQAHVEKLVGVIGNLGVTSGYLTTANSARRATWFWQTLTVAAMCVLSILAYQTLGKLESANGVFNWGMFAARVFLLVSLGVLAAYAGSQADKLFGLERRNRRLALELEAIGPFLATLPQEEQNKFRIQVGERSFGHDDAPVAGGSKSPATILDLLSSKEGKQFVEVIREVLKKG